MDPNHDDQGVPHEVGNVAPVALQPAEGGQPVVIDRVRQRHSTAINDIQPHQPAFNLAEGGGQPNVENLTQALADTRRRLRLHQEAKEEDKQFSEILDDEKKAKLIASYMPPLLDKDIKSWIKKVRAIFVCKDVPLYTAQVTDTYRPLIIKYLPANLVERIAHESTLHEIFEKVERYQLNVTGYLNCPKLLNDDSKPPSELYHDLVSEFNIKMHHPQPALVESMAWLTLKTHGQSFIKKEAVIMLINDSPTIRQLEALDEVWLMRGRSTQQTTSINAITSIVASKNGKNVKNGKNGKSGSFGQKSKFKKNASSDAQTSFGDRQSSQKSRDNANFEARKDKRVCWYHWRYEQKATKCNKAEYPNCPFVLHPNDQAES